MVHIIIMINVQLFVTVASSIKTKYHIVLVVITNIITFLSSCGNSQNFPWDVYLLNVITQVHYCYSFQMT